MKFAAGSPARSLRSLVVLNKKGGFDCPSCAWPDPDGRRHPAEFCENGAKAVAWETTDKRVGPEFFAKHSIAELASQPEQWLGDQGRITQPMVLRRGQPALRADRLGRRFRDDRRRAELAGQPRRGDVLHLGPREQRSGVLLSALRPAVRHQQPARLLEHVPRIERTGADASRSASARGPSSSTTSIMPTAFSSSARIPARTIREC